MPCMIPTVELLLSFRCVTHLYACPAVRQYRILSVTQQGLHYPLLLFSCEKPNPVFSLTREGVKDTLLP
jgi:hypothetical protein